MTTHPDEFGRAWNELNTQLDRAMNLVEPTLDEVEPAISEQQSAPLSAPEIDRMTGVADDAGASVERLVREEAVTELVGRSREGDHAARNALYSLVYEQLHRSAMRQQGRWPGVGDTMRPTVLVSELFVEFERRFPDIPRDRPEDRAWFYGCAAMAMRSILKKHWEKFVRRRPIPIGDLDPGVADDRDEKATPDYLELDAALERLREYNERWYKVAELKLFAGRTNDQISELVGRSKSVIKQDWTWCKAWLARELDQGR